MQRRIRSHFDENATEEPLINLTPLIDVVFVVLITFMLIAPVLDIDGVDLATSTGTEKKEMQPGPLTISVHADNSLWFKGKNVTLAQLTKWLKQEKKDNPSAIPQLLHDSKALFGTYQSVKNALEIAGFEQMDVVLKPGA